MAKLKTKKPANVKPAIADALSKIDRPAEQNPADLALRTFPVSVAAFKAFRLETKSKLAALESSIKTFPIEQGLPQEMLQTAALLSTMAGDFEKAWESLKVVLRARRHQGGKFEIGQAVIEFKSGERRAPAWKDEATNNAKKLAELAGEAFDPKLYQDKVLQATAAVPTADQVRIAVGE